MLVAIRRLYNSVTKKERKILLENFFSLTTLQGISYILPVLVLPYLIRTIGPERFGLIAFAQSLMQYFMIITEYGFNVTATRQIALCQQKQQQVCNIFSGVMTIKIILLCLCFFILILLIKFVPRFTRDWQVYCISFGTVVGNTLFPVWFYQGKENMRYIAVLNIISGLVLVLGIFIFVKDPSGFIIAVFLQSAISIIIGLYALIFAFRKFNLYFTVQTYPQLKNQLKEGWQIFSSIIAVNAYTTSRIFILGFLTNNTITGYYAVAERIAYCIQTFPLQSFIQAVFPRLSHIFQKNKKRAFSLLSKMHTTTIQGFLISLPLIFLISGWMIELVTGYRSQIANASLQILLLAVAVVGFNSFRLQYLLIANRTQIYAQIHYTMALLGVFLIFIWTYLFSYIGTAIATVFIEIGIFLLTAEALKEERQQQVYSSNTKALFTF
ncbi:MAG: flippase [Candidatus Omnitrophica bacterium]|nr:flippase [Candidatus Omnitrophota bacterium]